VEALCELQFTCPEQPEVIIGRLVDVAAWKSFSKNRLPVADIPAPIRMAEIALRAQPLFELRNKESSRLVRIGQSAVSYHLMGKYCGWEEFQPELRSAFDAVFQTLNGLTIARIGLRYVNALVPSRHVIRDVHELNLRVSVADTPLSGEMMLNYIVENDRDHVTATHAASPTYVQGRIPQNTRVVIDVDVHTRDGYQNKNFASVMEWIEDAHTYEKQAFFKLLPRNVIEKLRER
jgi:uncharacterized protein (TIGR04255 family)